MMDQEQLYFFDDSSTVITQTDTSSTSWHLQDHNYALPYPSTPPLVFAAEIDDVSCNTTVETTAPGNSDVWAGSVTRCICGFDHDDGFMICCDGCSVWQHVDCMGISRNAIPDSYFCEQCDPRPIDQYSAIRLQTRKSKRFVEPDSDSETDTDEEAPQRRFSTRGRRRRSSSTSFTARTPRDRVIPATDADMFERSSSSYAVHPNNQPRDTASINAMAYRHDIVAPSSSSTLASPTLPTRGRRRSSLRMSSDQGVDRCY